MKKSIMYIEEKTNGLHGKARIGWVGFSKTGKTLYYQDKVFRQSKGVPLKANYYDVNSLQDYWISRPKRNGQDSLMSQIVDIDENVRQEYWQLIRKAPNKYQQTHYQSIGKSKSEINKLQKALRRRQMDNGWMPK